jgi:hypothetical protein
MNFPDKMEEHLVSFKENTQYIPATNPRKKWEYLEVSDNLYPPVRHGFMQYAYDSSINFHDYARHVRSSQIFGFNIFYPLLTNHDVNGTFVERLVPVKGEIDHWHFEYQPERDYLGEWQGPLKPIDYITSVDFAIFLKCLDGKRVAILTEVKFTEDKFTDCGGYKSNGNKNKDFCVHTFNINNIDSCYLAGTKRRKYFQLVKGVYNEVDGSVCPFINNNQCMRNHAFAKALVAANIVDRAYFVLVFHDENKPIQHEWQQYKSTCVESEKSLLFEVKASSLVSCSPDKTYKKYISDRYELVTSEIK